MTLARIEAIMMKHSETLLLISTVSFNGFIISLNLFTIEVYIVKKHWRMGSRYKLHFANDGRPS